MNETGHQQQTIFSRFARWIAAITGRPKTFGFAVLIILVWAITGPLFHFSDTWQLVINTGTTIITFLMVFLIQNTQNRDTEALQIKLDELIRAVKGARNEVIDLEEMDETQLNAIRQEYLDLADHARRHIELRDKAHERHLKPNPQTDSDSE
ncbi:MAG: low affinity iron permease family protein [Acidobacteria bacterium]|nr:MAG: low affinity iron permease family protein [Acidobacteriota bacterium]